MNIEKGSDYNSMKMIKPPMWEVRRKKFYFLDKRSKCKTRNYKTPRGEPRQNTLQHKSQQDPL